MALLTRSAAMGLLSKIMESGGLTEDMEKMLGRLRDDFDEREGILKKYGETYDGEDRDEYEWTERDGASVYTSKEGEKDWKKEYDNLQQRYIKRFFGVLPESERTKEEEYRLDDTVIKEDDTQEPKSLDELILEEEN